MPDLRSILQSILALYGLAVTPRHRGRPPTTIGHPANPRLGRLSRP
jgi:hypothetical protein